jgi:hypothetical protein
MGISDVCSPVTRKGSKIASAQPLSPGARSAPGDRHDSIPPQPQHRVSTHQEQQVPSSSPVTIGPQE